MIARRTIACSLLLLFCGFAIPKNLLAQEANFDKLPSRLADSIHESKTNTTGTITVFIADFKSPEGADTELGLALASGFADSLRKQSKGFVVLSRSDLKPSLAKLNLREDVLSSSAFNCYVASLPISLLVEGTIEERTNGFRLEINAWSPKTYTSLFSGKMTLRVNASTRDLISKPILSPTEFFIDDKKAMIQPDHSAPPCVGPAFRIPEDEKRISSEPDCIQCPYPKFPATDFPKYFDGTVELRVRIEPDGNASMISVVHGLSYGFTGQAIAAVKDWRFKPAIGLDGKPVVAEMIVLAKFHRY